MNEYKHEKEDHSPFAILFNSLKIENYFKKQFDKFPYIIVTDKNETRFQGMIEHGNETFYNLIVLAEKSIKPISKASGPLDASSMLVGEKQPEISGFIVCKECLNKAILAAEDNLNVLKDMQISLSKYEPVK